MNYNTLSVKNFGPVKKADINISPLTIFIGDNNSGKSYTALLIHSLLNLFNQNDYNNIINNEEVFSEFKKSISDYVGLKPKISDESFKFPMPILKDTIGNLYCKNLEEKLKDNFTDNLNNLNRFNKDPFEFKYNSNIFVNESGKLTLTQFIPNIELKNKKFNDKICLWEINDEYLSVNLNYYLWDNIVGDADLIGEIIFLMIISEIDEKKNSYYLPSSNEMLDDFTSNELNKKLNTPQKELLENFLKVTEEIKKGSFYDIAHDLEDEILQGEIKISKEKVIFVDREYNMKFDLNLTSSSIREMAPLIIYLKYYLKKGDTLIIEEPENHIHPKQQLKLVKYLVKAVNNGLKLIITTHSDYIVEKFNNFIMLGNTDEKIFKKYNYSKNDVLNYEDVNIYNFKKENISVAKAVEINHTGFDEDSFFNIHNEIYDESVDMIDSYQ